VGQATSKAIPFGTPPPSNDDVARLNEVIAQRVRRFLLFSGVRRIFLRAGGASRRRRDPGGSRAPSR